jgi:hypothetical protein
MIPLLALLCAMSIFFLVQQGYCGFFPSGFRSVPINGTGNLEYWEEPFRFTTNRDLEAELNKLRDA